MKKETRGRKFKDGLKPKRRVCITLNPDIHQRGKDIAFSKRLSLSNMIEKILIDLKLDF